MCLRPGKDLDGCGTRRIRAVQDLVYLRRHRRTPGVARGRAGAPATAHALTGTSTRAVRMADGRILQKSRIVFVTTSRSSLALTKELEVRLLPDCGGRRRGTSIES